MSHSAPPLETPVAETPDPSLKTGEAYSQDMRRLVEVLLQSFAMTPKQTKEIRDTVQKLPSYRTIQRWKNHLQERGHLRPFRRSGGKRKGRRLKGMNIIYLAIYRLVYPKGSSAEINAFLYRMNYGNPHFKFFSHSQICRAEQLLGLTRKRGSTTAFKALLPQVVSLSTQPIVPLERPSLVVVSTKRAHTPSLKNGIYCWLFLVSLGLWKPPAGAGGICGKMKGQQ